MLKTWGGTTRQNSNTQVMCPENYLQNTPLIKRVGRHPSDREKPLTPQSEVESGTTEPFPFSKRFKCYKLRICLHSPFLAVKRTWE